MMKKVKVKLKFPPELTGEAVTYRLIKDYDLIFNILNAQVNPGHNGSLIMELQGEDDAIAKGIKYLESRGLQCSLFTKSIIWNDDKCVHCGTCTSVCVAGALRLSPDTKKLTFDREKCLVCEMCCHACPMRAIDVDVFQ